MQIVKLRLDHVNFYCPVTGQLISNEAEGQFGDSPALKGYWVNLTPDEPFHVAPDFTTAWESYISAVDEDDYPDIAEFLASVEEPGWVAFENEYAGVQGDVAWIVIDMNYDVNA